MERARVNFNGWIKVWVSDEDIKSWDGYTEAVHSGMGKEDILAAVAHDKISNLDPNSGTVQIEAEGANIDNDSIDWDGLMHPAEENPNLDFESTYNTMDYRDRPPKESLSSRRTAEANPAQTSANEALKVAKELQDLLNMLAGLTSRDQIAQAAGLTQLPETIEKLYQLADQLRAGGVQQLGQPQATYAGWDLDKIIRQAKPFVDMKTVPIEQKFEPEEEFMDPRDKAASPTASEVQMDK